MCICARATSLLPSGWVECHAIERNCGKLEGMKLNRRVWLEKDRVQFSCEKVVCFCATRSCFCWISSAALRLPLLRTSRALPASFIPRIRVLLLLCGGGGVCWGQRVVDFLSIFLIVIVSVCPQLAAKVAHFWLRAPWINPGSVANQTL